MCSNVYTMEGCFPGSGLHVYQVVFFYSQLLKRLTKLSVYRHCCWMMHRNLISWWRGKITRWATRARLRNADACLQESWLSWWNIYTYFYNLLFLSFLFIIVGGRSLLHYYLERGKFWTEFLLLVHNCGYLCVHDTWRTDRWAALYLFSICHSHMVVFRDPCSCNNCFQWVGQHSFYPCSSRELMNIQLLSEILNLNVVLNNDSEHASVFHYCLP